MRTSGDERWTEPLVSVEILGHCWVPDLNEGGAPDASLAEFLAYKFGIEVTEHNDTWWEGGDGDDGA